MRLSFHVYPLWWLMREAGWTAHYFLLHITKEAAPIYDPKQRFTLIRNTFRFKKLTRVQIEAGLRIIAALDALVAADFTARVRTRYFWGLRTSVLAAAAEMRRPCFSGAALEAFIDVAGMANHIRNRKLESFEACKLFGALVTVKVVKMLGPFEIGANKRTILECLRWEEFPLQLRGEIIYGE